MGEKSEKPTYKNLEKELEGLKRSQAEWAKLSQVIMQSPRMVIIMDPEGIVESVNQRFTDISGYTEKDILGKRIPLFGEKSLKNEKERLEQLRSGKIILEELLNRRKDGSAYWENASISTVKDNAGVITHLVKIAEEISGHKEITDSIIERERKYRSIIETMPEGYFEVDLAGNFTFVNEVMAMIHGRTRNELIGLNYKEYTAPEEQEKIYKIYNKVYKTGFPSEIHDYEITAGDGSRTISEVLVTLIRDALGTPVGFQGFSRDVTARRAAERALKESEEKYRNILETMEEGYYEVDLTGTFTFVNEAECRIHKRTREELIGLNNRAIADPETAKRVYNIYNEIYRTGVPSKVFDYQITRSDGEVITLETSGSLMRDPEGKPIGFRGISRDVTEKKKAEHALRESEEKYRLLVENANDGICIIQDGFLKFSNPKVGEHTGYSIEELESIPFLDLVHPEDRASVTERQQRKPEDGSPSWIYSFRMTNREGETLWVEINTVPIHWEGSRATLNFLRDITPQKKMEDQLIQAQKMEAIGTLAGGIAHDFNNLLMGIQGNASLVLLDIDSDHPHHDKLRSIEQLVKDGSELTKQLLGMARGGKYEVKPTDINKIVKISSEIFGRTKKEITIHKSLEEDIWIAEVDRSQIQQVLINIYVNAWHAMKEGGDLYIETRNVVLDEYSSRTYGVDPGKFIKVSITDTGIGMDEDVLKRVFDPFFTTKEMGRGTGLGLASAYGIIRNHNGIINAYSEKGSGTTFNIYLPISNKTITEESDDIVEIISGSETVLFVDDEAALVQIGHKLLKKLGYKVLTARSGEKALEIYHKEKEKIDLVILDLIMPGMSGGETFKKLKQIDPQIKVLLSSGYSINGRAKELLDRGCDGFLQKPFNLGSLSKKIRQILDN
jgi:PAS domain S-box-containing protein